MEPAYHPQTPTRADRDRSPNSEETTANDTLLPDEIWQSSLRCTQVFEAVPTTTTRLPHSTRLVCLSDTHGRHRDLVLPEGDVVIHAGDMTKSGEPGNVRDLAEYLSKGCRHKDSLVIVAGNHDITLDEAYYEQSWRRFHRKGRLDVAKARSVLNDQCTYLQDASATIRGDLSLYGSPWSPEYFGWAFSLPRGRPLREKWSAIPDDTDDLVTHGPPLGRGDRTEHAGHVGCYDLLQRVQQVRPRVHIFGHIHEGYGTSFDGHTLYVNAAVVDVQYKTGNQHCIVVDVPHDKSLPAHVVQPQYRLSAADWGAWLRQHGYDLLACYAADGDVQLRDEDLQPPVYRNLCDRLLLHRDPTAQRQLAHALSTLYAVSMATTICPETACHPPRSQISPS